jgi:hypothetical protein
VRAPSAAIKEVVVLTEGTANTGAVQHSAKNLNQPNLPLVLHVRCDLILPVRRVKFFGGAGKTNRLFAAFVSALTNLMTREE